MLNRGFPVRALVRRKDERSAQLESLGADVVGMSTIPEAIICAHEGIRASAIGVVTDLCDPDDLKKVSVEEILAVATEAEPKLTRLVVKFLND